MSIFFQQTIFFNQCKTLITLSNVNVLHSHKLVESIPRLQLIDSKLNTLVNVSKHDIKTIAINIANQKNNT